MDGSAVFTIDPSIMSISAARIITQSAATRAYALIAPFLDDADRRIHDRFAPEELETVIEFLTYNREIQEGHTERLRQLPAPCPPRTGGRQAPP